MAKRLYSSETVNKKKKFIVFAIVFALILVASVIFITLTHYDKCDTWECFNENIAACTKTKFIGGEDIIFKYIIYEKTNDECRINVTLYEGELNNQDTLLLKDKSMICSLESGVVALPESDLSKCHGELKESLQEQVINDLYTYLIQNLGQINKNIVDPLGIINE